MSSALQSLLANYEDYTSLLAKQIYRREVWSEQTGCELESEYFGYVACCENRLYDFGTWYEHTQGTPYPEGEEWALYRDHKYSLLAFHP